MRRLSPFVFVVAALACAGTVRAAPVVFEAASATVAGITPMRDAFRAAVGGGTVAGANGSFGGLRREINWDGVPAAFADPSTLPANFFNSNSPRGVVFSTPGSGFLVSANAGGLAPVLFGFANEFQAFSAQRLFTAVGSNVTDVNFFVAGTNTAATTSAFGLIFVDAEVAGQTMVDFFGLNDQLLFSRNALVGGNQGLSFLGASFNAGERIARVRITSGRNTIISNGALGNPIDDVVVMDDFLYAEPLATTVGTVPEPQSLALVGFGLLSLTLLQRRRRAPARPRAA